MILCLDVDSMEYFVNAGSAGPNPYPIARSTPFPFTVKDIEITGQAANYFEIIKDLPLPGCFLVSRAMFFGLLMKFYFRFTERELKRIVLESFGAK